MFSSLFIKKLLAKAKKNKKHILLVEGEDLRILKASSYIVRNKLATISLMGDPLKINKLAQKNNLNLKDVCLVDTSKKSKLALMERYRKLYLKVNKNDSNNLEKELASDLTLGSLMLLNNEFDGLVCGAVYSTKDSLRAAFKIIKKKEFSLVSSIFFMCLKSQNLVFGDCAVNILPDSFQLAEIAKQSALSAKQVGINPKIAFLSYSTGDSGAGETVEKIKEAQDIFSKKSNFLSEGPIQFDAAIDPSVSRQKLKDSKIKGKANVFIFPDLNSGNITYKAVQRIASAIAIGPILQGLKKPFNDLSRGAEVDDIILTIAVTAIQSQ